MIGSLKGDVISTVLEGSENQDLDPVYNVFSSDLGTSSLSLGDRDHTVWKMPLQ